MGDSALIVMAYILGLAQGAWFYWFATRKETHNAR